MTDKFNHMSNFITYKQTFQSEINCQTEFFLMVAPAKKQ